MIRKILSTAIVAVLTLSMLMLTAYASEDVTVSLRIEGIEECLFYGDVSVNEGETVYDVLLKADETDDSLCVTSSMGQYGAYITAINGITAGSYTALKWDGWLFMADGVSPSVGVDAYTVKNGESIVIYYGDPYNTGMQYPIISFDAETGTITVSSLDTVYDENWNSVTKECPVADYTLSWGLSDGTSILVKGDENGVAVIPQEHLTYGEHSIQIEKTAANGLPAVLRLAPDYCIEIPDERSIFEKIIDAITDFFNMIVNFFKTLFT